MVPPNQRLPTGGTSDPPPGRTAPPISTRAAGSPVVRGSGGTSGGDEDEVIARVARAMARVSGPPPAGSVWIGDDAAVVPPPGGPLLLATDAAVAGVHADLSLVGLDDLGWKALTATVSDVGAMGGRPLHALVTLCVPAGTDVDLLVNGVAEASARWACPVVGGDLTSAGQVVVSVAVTGTLDGHGLPVTRAGASPGDVLLVTGPLGASAAGLRLLREVGAADRLGTPPADLVAAHRRPAARVDEGVAARRAGASALIDVSDGLSIDLHRLADASGVGFRLEAVPTAAGATEEEALGGGEDYELVVAVPDDLAATLGGSFTAAGLRAPLVIGTCTADPAERLWRGRPLPRTGWQHRLR